MNTTAETILIVLRKLLKWGLIVILVVAFLLGAFIFYLDYKEKKDREKRKKLEDKVTISAYYSGKDCAPGYPYFYGVVNNGELSVEKVIFTVEIRRRGFSGVLNSNTRVTEDKILKPGEGYGRCFRAGREDYRGDVTEKDVDISVSSKEVRFLEKK